MPVLFQTQQRIFSCLLLYVPPSQKGMFYWPLITLLSLEGAKSRLIPSFLMRSVVSVRAGWTLVVEVFLFRNCMIYVLFKN